MNQDLIKYPKVNHYSYQTNIPGIYVIGSLTGLPMIKYAIDMGYEVMAGIDKAITYEGHVGDPNAYDVVIIGSGPAGLSAALEASNRGIKHVVLEQGKIANTIEHLQKDRIIQAVPDSYDVRGELWFTTCPKQELIAKWKEQISEYELNIRTGVQISDMRDYGEYFRCLTKSGDYFIGKRIILAMGKSGCPKKLGVSGENFSKVDYFITDPGRFTGEDICIVGNNVKTYSSALDLSERNYVSIVFEEDDFLDKETHYVEEIKSRIDKGNIKVFFNNRLEQIREFDLVLKDTKTDEQHSIPNTKLINLSGKEYPLDLFDKIGLKYEKHWDVKNIISLSIFSVLLYLIFAFLFGFYPLKSFNKYITKMHKEVPIEIWSLLKKADNVKTHIREKETLFKNVDKIFTKIKTQNGNTVKIKFSSKGEMISVKPEDREAIIRIHYKEGMYKIQEQIKFSFLLTRRIRQIGPVDENMARFKFKATIKEIIFSENGNYLLTIYLPESDKFISYLYDFWDKKGSLGSYPFNDPFFYYSIVFTLLALLMFFVGLEIWGIKPGIRKFNYRKWRLSMEVYLSLLLVLLLPYLLSHGSSWIRLVRARPLTNSFFYFLGTFFKIWPYLLVFVIIPLIFSLYGKQFCFWITGLGRLAIMSGEYSWSHPVDQIPNAKLESIEKLAVSLTSLTILLSIISGLLNINNLLLIIVIDIISVLSIILLIARLPGLWDKWLIVLCLRFKNKTADNTK